MSKKKNKTLIICELGVNHNGNIQLAKKMIKSAKLSGADVVKIQIFKTSELIIPNSKTAKYQKKNTKIDNQYELLKKLELSFKNIDYLISYAKKLKVKISASVFDNVSAKFLIKKKTDFIKIPSGEITNLKLLNFLSKHNKKIILSTGMANIKEINKAIKILTKYGLDKSKISLLHCISDYPAKIKNINLASIKFLKEKYKIKVGFSDHTKSINVPSLAVLAGASIIEKHFTLNKLLKGPDHKASLNPIEFKKMVKAVRDSETILGDEEKKVNVAEKKNLIYVRKSLVAKKKINKGEKFNEKNLTVKRPGDGICASNYLNYLNKIAKKNYKINEKI